MNFYESVNIMEYNAELNGKQKSIHYLCEDGEGKSVPGMPSSGALNRYFPILISMIQSCCPFY